MSELVFTATRQGRLHTPCLTLTLYPTNDVRASLQGRTVQRGLDGLYQVARCEKPTLWRSHGWINPGPVETDRHTYLLKTRARTELGDENRYSELVKDLPLGRAAKPCEIADMAVFLASDCSAYPAA